MFPHKLIILAILIIIATACSNNHSIDFNRNYKLTHSDFSFVKITMEGELILESNEKDLIQKIVKEINNNKRELATEMEFERGPEGLITLIGDEEVEIAFFKDSGRSIYGDYYIHTEFDFE